MTDSPDFLSRYTDLASLLDMLSRKSITLLPPSTWDDKNDRLMMETYKECKSLQTLLALCLTSRAETYHHWKVFTDKSSGVCIQFYREPFIEAMSAAGVKVRGMDYLTLKKLKPKKYKVEDLPFLKRWGYGDEGEHRAVYECATLENGLKKVRIDFRIIHKVSLNPWMPNSVYESTKEIIEALREGASFEVGHSSLIDSKAWRRFAASYKPTDLA